MRRIGFCLAAMLLSLTGRAPAAESGIDPALAKVLDSVSPDRLRADDAALVAFGTRNIFSENAGAARGITAARDWIAAQFRQIAATSGGRMTVTIDSFEQPADGKRIVRAVELSNVLAVLRGSEPGSRTYIVSSHYDSRDSDATDPIKDAPGADDNGSGVVTMLAAARALAALPTRATIIFAAYTAEEQGLFGSAHHAAALKAAGVDVEGDINNDIVGASVGPKGETNPHSMRIFSEELPAGSELAKINESGSANDSPARELARFAKEIGDRAVPLLSGQMIYRADRFRRGGDQMSFSQNGFPAIRFVEPVENFDHQHQDVRVEGGKTYGDLIEFMDFDYLALVARYNIAVVGALALAPRAPTEVAMLTKDLSNETDLRWASVSGAVRYEVVTRRTNEAYWSGTVDAGAALAAHIALSKDNYLFGVRAVDEAGHESPVTFALPQR